LISRVAESCFWLNRYIERAEVLARILDVNLAHQLDVDLPEVERWRPLVVVTGQEPHFLETTPGDLVNDGETVQRYLTWSRENPSSLLSCIRAARENARTIRETISLEMWETLNDLWVWMSSRSSARLYDKERHDFYLRIRNQCLLFHGMAQATLLHEDPLHFMRLGTAIERMGQTARVLDVKHHAIGPTRGDLETPAEAAEWLTTLRFCSGFEPFFKRQDNVLSGRAVADFLIFDPKFPRSIAHNANRTLNFLTLVRAAGGSRVGAESEALLRETIEQLSKMDIDGVLAQGLHQVLTWVVDRSGEIGELIRREFFDPAPEIQAQSQSQA